jgi:hypothetical protein
MTLSQSPAAGLPGQRDTRGQQVPGRAGRTHQRAASAAVRQETRNATVFIAVMAGVVAVVVLIGVIIAGIQLASLTQDLSGVSTLG